MFDYRGSGKGEGESNTAAIALCRQTFDHRCKAWSTLNHILAMNSPISQETTFKVNNHSLFLEEFRGGSI